MAPGGALWANLRAILQRDGRAVKLTWRRPTLPYGRDQYGILQVDANGVLRLQTPYGSFRAPLARH